MGGPKEQLVNTDGQSLLEFQVDRLSPHFDDILLLGNADLQTLPENVRSIPDPSPYTQLGPLAGLLAGLHHCQHPWLALLPIDCPRFPVASFHHAWSKREPEADSIGFAASVADRPQWLPGLFHQSLIPTVEQALVEGRRALGALIKQSRHQYVSWESPMSFEEAFINLNTPEEAAKWGYSWQSLPQ